MSKKILLTIVGISLVIIGSLIYVLIAPRSEQSSEQKGIATENSPAPTPAPLQENTPAVQPGVYTDYSENSVATTTGTKLLFFHAPWCPQCREIEASIQSEGIPNGVTVFKIDYDSNQTLREKYGVTLQTTFVKIDDAGNKIASYVAYEEPRFSSVEQELLR